MHNLKSRSLIAALAIATLAGSAFAQERTTVTVDLSGLSRDYAGSLDVGVGRIPDSVTLSSDLAAAACGGDASSIGDSCTAVTATPELTAAVEAEVGANDNSARTFAPGHQDGPAKDVAPGRLSQPAADNAPGHLKESASGHDKGSDHGHSRDSDHGESSGQHDKSGK